MAKAPVPLKFPGEFFVLEWDRDTETFLLRLDDPDESSFELSSEPIEVVHLLHMRFRDSIERREFEDVVDRAREFGGCAYNPGTRRIVQVIPRIPREPALDFGGEQNVKWTPNLYD